MNYEKDCGPYKATRMWNEMIHLFENEIPLRRHRRHIKVYENCFTGLEAINWFHNALQNTLQMRHITREQAIQLLSKFLKAGVYESISTPNGPAVIKEGELYRLKQTSTGFIAFSDGPTTQYLKVPLAVRSNNHEHMENVNPTPSLGKRVLDNENIKRRINQNSKQTYVNLHENEYSYCCNTSENAANHGQSILKWGTGSLEIDQGGYKKSFSEHNIVTQEQGFSKASGNINHVYTEGKPWLPKAESWKAVVLCRLELLMPGLSEQAKKVPAKWIAANASGSVETNFMLHESLVKGLQYLQQWPQAAASGTLFAIEEYLKNLTEPLTTCRLYKPMTMILSSLSPSRIGQCGRSSVLDTVLPPNTCFETAFTSDSPITRIVPQSSFDTLHLNWCSRQKEREFANVEGTQHCAASQCWNKDEGQFECEHLSHVRSSCGGYVNPIIAYSKDAAKTPHKQQGGLQHIRNKSGGYVNPALDDMDEVKLDYDAALGYLQLLMRCSLEKPVLEDSGSESSSYYTAVSSSSSSPISSRRSSRSLDPGDVHHNNGVAEEKLEVAAMQLLLLCIPPYSRFQLRFLLQFIKYWNLDNPDMNVIPVFSSSVIRSYKASEVDAENSCKILKFLTVYQDYILSIPAYLQAEVDQHAAETELGGEESEVRFCEQVSHGQRLSSSQQALSELLEQILSDFKMPAKEKRRRLRMFQKTYPHIYQRRFPESVEPEKTVKKQTKSILNFGKSLKSLRM